MHVILRRVYRKDSKILCEDEKLNIEQWSAYQLNDYITTLLAKDDTVRIIIEQEN